MQDLLEAWIINNFVVCSIPNVPVESMGNAKKSAILINVLLIFLGPSSKMLTYSVF
jgi:hypothetical protein